MGARAYLLTTVFFFLLIVHPAVAEIYHCGNKWTTEPCSENAQPVKNLPKITRAEIGKQPSESKSASAKAPQVRARLARPSTVLGEECRPKPNGVEIKGLGIRLVERRMENQSAFYLRGTVRNSSSKPLSTPLTLRISSTDNSGVAIENTIADSLYSGVSKNFSIPVQLPEDRTRGNFIVSLNNSDLQSCPTWRVRTGDVKVERIVERTGFGGAASRVYTSDAGYDNQKEARSELEELRREARNLKTKYRRFGRSESDLFFREKAQLLAQVDNLCSRAQQNNFSRTAQRCADLKRELELLD